MDSDLRAVATGSKVSNAPQLKTLQSKFSVIVCGLQHQIILNTEGQGARQRH